MTAFSRVGYNAVIVFAETYGISQQVCDYKKIDFEDLISDIKAQDMI